MADGDADQETGASGDAGPQTTGDSGDANPQEKGDDGGSDQAVPQHIYDKAYAEARKTFQSELSERDETIESLKSEIESLKDSEDKRKAAEERSDVYTEDQVKELKESLQSEIEQRDEAVKQANHAHARTRLAEELREQGVVKPELFADMLVEKGRVQADVTEGFDVFEVRTADGTKMITESGDEATVGYLAEKWASQNPELVRDGQQNGAGFDEGGEPRPKSLEDMQRQAEQSGDMEAAGRAKAARAMQPAS